MERRALLRLLAMGVIGHTLDVDKLLWVPGAKTFFIPKRPVYIWDTTRIDFLTASEMAYARDKLRLLFERDDMFYNYITKIDRLSSIRSMKMPLKKIG